MLIGKSIGQKVVNLLSHTRKEIELLKQEKWHCPSCEQPLVIKNGRIKQAHFAHYSKEGCDVFSEGETEEHLQGKKILADWCQKNQVPYELEAYLDDLKQRPDLLIGNQLAIEFQCSHLSMERFIERTLNYRRHGYQVIWLLGEQFFLKNNLSVFQRSCINYHQNVGFYFWELDVTAHQLRCQIHIEETLAGHHLYFEERQLPIGERNILRSLAFPEQAKIFVTRYYEGGRLLLDSLHKFDNNLTRREATMMKLQEKLYYQGTHLRELPSIYFLPITQPLVAKDSVIIWRLLFWQCLEAYPNQSPMELNSRFHGKLAIEQPKMYVMPLIHPEEPINLFIQDYLRLLKRFKLITIKYNKIKIINRPGKYPNSEIRRQVISGNLEKYKHISATPHKDMLL